MKDLNNLTEDQAETNKIFIDLLESGVHAVEERIKRREAMPFGENKCLVIVNEFWTAGLADDGRTIKLYSRTECRGYDSETARNIKRSFKGKDGNGREIQTSEIQIVNGRNYLSAEIDYQRQLHEKMVAAYEAWKNK